MTEKQSSKGRRQKKLSHRGIRGKGELAINYRSKIPAGRGTPIKIGTQCCFFDIALAGEIGRLMTEKNVLDTLRSSSEGQSKNGSN